jgi:hypothetical protein
MRMSKNVTLNTMFSNLIIKDNMPKANMFLFAILLMFSISTSFSEYASTCRNFDCEYKLLSKLVQLKERTAQQQKDIALLTAQLEGKKFFCSFNNLMKTKFTQMIFIED